MSWWDIDLTSLFNFPQADKGSALASCNDTSGALHGFYINNKSIVHGYPANSTWANANITPAAGPPAALGTALCAFFDTNGGHVFYDALDENVLHVHQLTGTPWWDLDLTQNTPALVGEISGYLNTTGAARVYYISSADQHVHQLALNKTWGDLDLTSMANGPNAATTSPLSSFYDISVDHVFYIGVDGHVHQLYNFMKPLPPPLLGLEEWVDQDLTNTAIPVDESKVPPAAAGSGLSGFVDSYGPHVFYVDSNQHVHHLILTAENWSDYDLTGSYNGPQAAKATALSSFGDGYGDHVVYISADQHVHQLYFDNAVWVDQDLTSTATPFVESKVPLAAVGSALSSLSNNLGELIFYISADQHVHLLCFADKPPGALGAACPGSTVGEVGVPYSSSLGLSGGMAPYKYSITPANGLPPGLSQPDPSTGLIQGTPTTAGTFNFTVKVTDAKGQTATTASCPIKIAPAVTPSCPGVITGQVGVLYSSSLGLSGGVSPYTFAIASGGLPPGLSLNPSTGAITGTPTTAGPFNFTVKVTDAAGGTATTLGCHITIAAPAAPSLSFQCPTGLGQVGVPYNSSLVPSGGTAPYKFAIISWGLPSPGLNLNPLTGAITGTPTTANPIVFTATVTDATGATFKGSCPIVIEPKMAVSCPGANGQTEEEYSSSLVASGGVSPYTFAIASGGLPPGLSLNPSTGAITGTPTAVGPFPFTATATDATGATATTNGCGITVTGTFVINALWSPGQYTQGPFAGLNFVISGDSQDLPCLENPKGTYTVSGVLNGEELALDPTFVDNNWYLTDSTGTQIAQTILVTLAGTSGSTTIYVALPKLM